MNLTSRLVPVLLVIALEAAAPSAHQDLLDRVKSLYAAAAYEDALAAMPADAAPDGSAPAGEIDQYRALCLIALNRSNEAVAAIERVIIRNPLFVPSPAETSPRLQTMYTEARSRLLPDLVKRTYADGKAALQAHDHGAAQTAFRRALELIASAPEAQKAALDDLRVLALEFSQLADARSEPASGTPAVAGGAPLNPAPPAVAPPWVAPVVIQQRLPAWSPPDAVARRTEYRGQIRITIESDGRVVTASVVRPTHPHYDAAVLRAARQWLYVPATLGGVAVRAEKDIAVHLRPQ